jgi:hypothetical protein
MKITGFYVNHNFAIDHTGQKGYYSNILDWLLKYSGGINGFYHLSYNVACILRMIHLSDTQLKELQDFGDTRFYFNEYREKVQYDRTVPKKNVPRDIGKKLYSIFYLHNKYFAIQKDVLWDDPASPYVQFCDIAQYLPWRVDDDHTEEYALNKAREACKTATEVYNGLLKLKITPENLTSPIRCYEKAVINRMNLPTIDAIPEEAAHYAYQCCHGGWLEAFKKGHYQAYDYDISSAYPNELANQKELRFGMWENEKEYNETADLGYLYGKLTMNAHFNPFLFKANDMTYSPVGEYECCITKRQYEVLMKYQLGEFEIENAWWWYPKSNVYPLRAMIGKLYTHKETTSGMDKEVTKRIMSGMWGKLLELKNDTFGDHFNPVWGCEVEVNTRMKVFEACINSGVVPLSIAVDGVLTDKPLNVEVKPGLGNWKLTYDCPALVVSSGIVAVKDKQHNQDFALDYQWLVDEINKNPEVSEYVKSKPSPVSLNKALVHGDLSKLGNVEQITRTVDTLYEAKRCYPIAPVNGGELLANKYESVAWPVSLFEMEKYNAELITADPREDYELSTVS